MRNPVSRLLWIAASVVLASFTVTGSPASARDMTGAAPPRFTLPALAGTADLDSLRGRVVLVDFWASWCAPCARSFPWMTELHRRYAGRGLAIVAIDLDKDRELAEKFLTDHPAPFTIAFDPKGRTAEAWHVRAMPTTFLLGRDGTVLMAHPGFDPGAAAGIEARIEKALAS
jgi:cytochrome c biogenesis protein CcmG/thiol:disulfide interchange protein DsbE